MIYEKYRELTIDLFSIKYRKIRLRKIISYPPAGNDVVEAIATINNKDQNVFIKFERSKMANFETEYKHLNLLKDIKLFPKVIEFGSTNSKNYIVLEKILGERLSDIFKNNKDDKDTYLKEYGKCLSQIHSIKNKTFDYAFQRPINDIPKGYSNSDEFSNNIINYLKENNFEKNNNTFIHGDFHYANVLFKDKMVTGVLDLEYSGYGFKEQDIAWSCILRPNQEFMDNLDDIFYFLEGYKCKNNFDYDKFKWCYINGSMHFYLMNYENEEYKEKLKELIREIMKSR